MSYIFVNPSGQRDNIGDSVLRRPYLEALRGTGELHVLVGRDDDYASGLGLRPEDKLYISRLRWLRAAFICALHRSMSFAANAGEYVGHIPEMLKGSWQLILAVAARATGGDVFLAGASVRPGTTVRLTHLPVLARLSSVTTFRDLATRNAIGRGDIQPDWAFTTGSGYDAELRPRLAVVLRGDRPIPSERWFSRVRALAEAHGLEPCTVVQVRRDGERAGQIAEVLGGACFDWLDSQSHSDQEDDVRSIYRESKYVLSDRIHALILAATEGAVPVAFSTVSTEKIDRTFAHVFGSSLPRFSCDEDVQTRLPASASEVLRCLEMANTEIGRVAKTIQLHKRRP